MVHWEYVPQIITYTPKQTFPFLHRYFCNTATPFRCNLAKEALKLCTYITYCKYGPASVLTPHFSLLETFG